MGAKNKKKKKEEKRAKERKKQQPNYYNIMQCATLHNSGNGVIIHIELMLRHQASILMCVRKALWAHSKRASEAKQEPQQQRRHQHPTTTMKKMKPLWIGWWWWSGNGGVETFSPRIILDVFRHEACGCLIVGKWTKVHFIRQGHCVRKYVCIVFCVATSGQIYSNLFYTSSLFLILLEALCVSCVWLFFFTFSSELFAFGAIATLWSTFVALQMSFTTRTPAQAHWLFSSFVCRLFAHHFFALLCGAMMD